MKINGLINKHVCVCVCCANICIVVRVLIKWTALKYKQETSRNRYSQSKPVEVVLQVKRDARYVQLKPAKSLVFRLGLFLREKFHFAEYTQNTTSYVRRKNEKSLFFDRNASHTRHQRKKLIIIYYTRTKLQSFFLVLYRTVFKHSYSFCDAMK